MIGIWEDGVISEGRCDLRVKMCEVDLLGRFDRLWAGISEQQRSQPWLWLLGICALIEFLCHPVASELHLSFSILDSCDWFPLWLPRHWRRQILRSHRNSSGFRAPLWSFLRWRKVARVGWKEYGMAIGEQILMNFVYPPWKLRTRPSNYLIIDDFPIPACMFETLKLKSDCR